MTLPPLEEPDFADTLSVSRETTDRLRSYVALLTKWNPRINLVAPATLHDVWRRHILDSAQLWPLLPKDITRVIDLGAGAGLPGLVLAILGVANVHLIESDLRKAAFLSEAARQTGTLVTIHSRRAEAVQNLQAPVVTARALAPLSALLRYALPLLAPGGYCLFPKGKQYREEMAVAAKTWHFSESVYPSVTDPSGAVLRLENIIRVRDR